MMPIMTESGNPFIFNVNAIAIASTAVTTSSYGRLGSERFLNCFSHIIVLLGVADGRWGQFCMDRVVDLRFLSDLLNFGRVLAMKYE